MLGYTTNFKFDVPRGSDHARAASVELDAAETMEEELVGIGGGEVQVGAMTVEIGHGAVLHGCSADDVMKGQAK